MNVPSVTFLVASAVTVTVTPGAGTPGAGNTTDELMSTVRRVVTAEKSRISMPPDTASPGVSLVLTKVEIWSKPKPSAKT